MGFPERRHGAVLVSEHRTFWEPWPGHFRRWLSRTKQTLKQIEIDRNRLDPATLAPSAAHVTPLGSSPGLSQCQDRRLGSVALLHNSIPLLVHLKLTSCSF